MVRQLILSVFTIILFSSGAKAQIIDEDCPFDFLPTVVFDKGSVVLTKASMVALDSFANYLIYNPTCSLKIVGSNGKGNRKLVNRRLAKVVEYLNGKDVKESRFIVTYSILLPTTSIAFRKAT